MSTQQNTYVKIGNMKVGLDDSPLCVISEIGINHCGSLDMCKQMILKSKEAGADICKIQKRSVDRILTKKGLERPYVNRNSFGATYGEHKRKLEFNEEQCRELKEYADSVGIMFTASVWDEESADLIDRVGVEFFKMASADLTNYPLLEHVAKLGKPMIISTGMADMQTVRDSVALVQKYNKQLVLLHCTSSYPTPTSHVNMNVLHTYSQEFPDVVIGFSNHSSGISLPFGAFVLGSSNKLLGKRNCCSVIECHFTLDRALPGGDQSSSLEFSGFSKLVRDVREFEEALGSYDKKFQSSEVSCFNKLAKSVVSACNIAKGTVITRNMLTTKGPMSDDYFSAKYLNDVVGKEALVDITADLNIEKSWLS